MKINKKENVLKHVKEKKIIKEELRNLLFGELSFKKKDLKKA